MLPTPSLQTTRYLLDAHAAAGAGTRDLVPVQEHLPAVQLREVLMQAGSLAKRGDVERARISAGKGDFHDSLITRTQGWFEAHTDAFKPVSELRTAFRLGLTVLAAGVGFALGSTVGPPIGVGVGVALFAPTLGVAPLFRWLPKADMKARQAARQNLISLGALQPMLDRFRTATGLERALLGLQLVQWLEVLDQGHALSPAARVALESARDELAAEPAELRALATRCSRLVRIIRNTTNLTLNDVRQIECELTAAPAEQRIALAAALVDFVSESGLRLDYDANHALYALTLEPTATAASRLRSE